VSYEDLMAEVETEAKEQGLEFTCKDGKVSFLRPFLLLGDTELKNIVLLLDKVNDGDLSLTDRMGYADKILIAAADKKDSLRKSLADLPLGKKIKVIQMWMDAAGNKQLPES
jgi:hypothetical protein